MAAPETYRVYTAEPAVRRPGRVGSEMLRGLVSSRYMAYRLFLRELKSDYARSALGAVWDFLDPLVVAVIFYYLMSTGVIATTELGMPTVLYVVFGLLLYQSFVDAATSSVRLLRHSRSLLGQQHVPAEALMLSALYRVLLFTAIRVSILLVLTLVVGFAFSEEPGSAFSLTGFLLFCLLVPLIVLPGFAIGLLLAPLNVFYTDVERGVRLVLQPLRYASPVLWPIPWVWLNTINPVAAPLNNLREVAVTGSFANATALAVSAVVFALLGLFAWFVFHVSTPMLADK